ncbi:unnamed protein product [Dicrocoelium dendriticum]|nr:unnamed protein product [Dicrocoelium dendriticum]
MYQKCRLILMILSSATTYSQSNSIANLPERCTSECLRSLTYVLHATFGLMFPDEATKDYYLACFLRCSEDGPRRASTNRLWPRT